MVSVLANGFKVRGLKPARERSILRAIRIRSTPSFGGEVMSSVHVVSFYCMLNITAD
jgi:hypothetical protein